MQFGKHQYNLEMLDKYPARPIDEIVAAIGDLLNSGKIKQWGLSNESAYGVTMMCESAKRLGVPLPVSIQNDYSITDRCVLQVSRVR
jgi:aryl-alcohol dehydrogenase-like predicted oxidoreductase